jgi:chromosome segregation ATPase
MDKKALAEDGQATALPTSALEAKLRTLREQSQKHSQALTQKLATSQSGQNLLHIGTSLSTLPPDLHSLLTQLHPLLSATEGMEKECSEILQKLVACANDIRIFQRRIDNARDCFQLYEDLEASERDIHRDAKYRRAADGMEGDLEQGVVLGTHTQKDMT